MTEEKSGIGNMVASFPAVPLGPLFYRALETDKIVGLKRHRQNYDAEIELSNEACSELVRWKHNIKNLFQDLVIPKPDITIFTDASETGWGITDWHNTNCVKSVQIRSFFWSVFSCIQTEYGELRRKSP